MNSSDDESNSSQENEFVTHFAASAPSKKKLPDLKRADAMVDKVWKIHRSILRKAR